MQTDIDPSAIIVPFGKHRGATVAELLARDPGYVEWLQAQGWLAQRFAEIHKALATRGARTDDTPEHNALQARFLDDGVRMALLRLIEGDRIVRRVKSLLVSQHRRAAEWMEEIDGSVFPYWDYQDEKKREAERAAWPIRQNEKAALASTELAWLQRAKDEYPNTTVAKATSRVRFEINGVDVVISWGFSHCEPKDAHVYVAEQLSVELKPEIGDDFPSIMRQCNA